MGENRDYENLVLAAVVHDIGKFWQGTGEGGKHQELGAKFIRMHFPEKWQGAAGLVSLHHAPEKLASEEYERLKILMISDWLSSGEREGREDDETGKRINEPLISIFSEIDIGKGILKEKWYFPVKKLALDEENLFPKPLSGNKKDLTANYRKLWNEFVSELDNIKGISDFNAYFNTLFYILQKYTWCVPSAVYKDVPDISLFDHLKTTCAIAACLHKYHQFSDTWTIDSIDNRELPKFLIIGGDISGIQNHIYEITSVGIGGVAKRLRSRSFYVSMISEITIHRLLRDIDLPFACNLISSGGRFFLLAPNTEEVRSKFQYIKISISKWLMEEFHGNLYLNLASIELAGKDFEMGNFSRVIDKISDELERTKLAKFKEILYENEWMEAFKSEIQLTKLCQSCSKMPATIVMADGAEICNHCDQDKKIGDWLIDTKFISFSKEKPSEERIIRFFTDEPFYVVLHEKLRESSQYYLTLKLNDFYVGDGVDGFKMMANHVPICRDHVELNKLCEKCKKSDECSLKNEPSFPSIVSFDCIAELSEGNNLLGVLKADVDNLGMIFSVGLKKSSKDDIDKDTISRITQLSRMMDSYFSGWIQHLISTKYPDCYIVYSGGDDLLIAGPWNKIIDVSMEINKDFRQFTCENPNTTLSAGIFLCKSKFPIARSSELAGEELEKSKAFKEKNRVTIFNKTVEWRTLDEIMPYSQFLDEELKKKESVINPSFVYRLLKYNQMCESGKVEYIPKMLYDIARNIKKKGADDKTVGKLMKIRDEMIDMKISILCALYKSRR